MHCIWSLRSDGRHGVLPPDRVLPDGRSELILHLGDPFAELRDGVLHVQPRALLIGPSTKAMLLQSSREIDVLGARIHPGALRSLVPARIPDLCDAALSWADVGLRIGDGDIDAIASAGDHSIRIARFAALVCSLLIRDALDPLVQWSQERILSTRGTVRVDELARAAGLSDRQLQRRFTEAVGMGPKLLGKVTRLQHAAQLAFRPHATLATIAAGAGYSDQAHLARDFREHAGLPLSVYLQQSCELSKHFVG